MLPDDVTFIKEFIETTGRCQPRMPKNILILLLLLLHTAAKTQDSSSLFVRILHFPDKVFHKVDAQSSKLEQKLIHQTERYLNKLEKQELQLKRKLQKTDSLKAEELFGNVRERYKQMRTTLHSTNQSSVYSGHTDSLLTAMKFLNNNAVVQKSKALTEKLNTNVAGITQLKNRFDAIEQIRKQIKEQQERLKQALQNTPLVKALNKYKQHYYYYKERLTAYRETLNDPKKMGAELLKAANRIPAFQQFFQQHSELAALFPNPAGAGTFAQGAAIPGLQTTAQVAQLIQDRVGTGGPNVQQLMQQNMGQARDILSELKNKLKNRSYGSADDEMPDFKPNEQKTKSLKERLVLGTNFQTTSSRIYFPVTTDLGLSLGYKLNDKSIIGIGSSYKLGLGTGFNNMSLSHQGLGFRSFIDWKFKGNFWLSGGYEQNYLAVFRRIDELNNRTVWKPSALLGVSKVVDVKSKFFQKTKVQLLYDFLWRTQLPQTQAVLFRVGYNF